MTPRLALVAGAVAAFLTGGATPALAHGLGGRVDLPVPPWLFIYGAATAVIVSFVALGVLWKSPRLQEGIGGRRLSHALQTVLTGRAVELAVRALSLGFFALVVLAAASGDPSPADNLASVVVFIWFWVGLAFAHALLGNLWATLSPWDTLARVLDVGRRPLVRYPAAWGLWPATLLLLGFVWMELVSPLRGSPNEVLAAIAVYTVITLAGMAVFGRETWNRRGEAFAVYFGLLARISPLSRDEEGRVHLRPVLGGLPSLEPGPGLVAFVVVLIGSTTFDGISSSTLWVSRVGPLSTGARAAAGTAGLLGTIAAVALAYALSMGAAAAVAGTRWHPLAVRFVHSLVPISFAYVVAHYFSLLALEGQLVIPLLSDPLARGWNLLGTGGYRVNLAAVSATTVWYVQVAAIVAGHIGGVVLAHDRAIALFPPGRALRTQYALLAVMVMFTVGGLVILSG